MVARLLAPLVLASTVAAGTLAIVPASQAATIQAVLQPDGRGLMIANSTFNPGGETWSWERCDPALAACVPHASGQIVTTAGAPPNTVFRASSSLGDIGLSPIWRGDVSSVGPPSISGVVRANELVTPVAGQWAGGWDGDYDRFQLAACTDPAGTTGCTTLTDRRYINACPNDAAVLDPEFTGRYLRVADQRHSADDVFTSDGVLSPYGQRLWPQNAITSVGVVGQIARKAGRRKAGCGPPPLVDARISKKGIARVQCFGGCKAVLVGRHGTRVARDDELVGAPFTPGVEKLRLKRKALSHLGPGPVRFTLLVNGKRADRRTVFLG